MSLCEANLHHLPPRVMRPHYDRAAQKCGIVHLGIGAFHRAHQAVYTDDAMNGGDRDWAIVGVSLRSPRIAEQMLPQDGLYTVREAFGSQSSIRLIGSVRQILVAPQSPDAVIEAIAAPATQIVSLTVTEAGYLSDRQGGLDWRAPALADDLGAELPPRTIYGFLRHALARRRQRGLSGLTLLSCDNLANNGGKLAAWLAEFLEASDPSLRSWVHAHCRCPSTMVDRIVPATTPLDRDRIAGELGLRDDAMVATEPFRQWVIEDDFVGRRPHWEHGGAQWVADVAPFETAKLRMLNGSHSALAYLGLARGYEFVHQAVADPTLNTLINRLMRQEAGDSLGRFAGFDPDAYADALIARFANSALSHRLAQIAMDGSQKIPQRWLETLRIQSAKGKDCGALITALAAWIAFLREQVAEVGDPMAVPMMALWQQTGRSGIVDSLFGPRGVFAQSWTATPAQSATLTELLPL